MNRDRKFLYSVTLSALFFQGMALTAIYQNMPLPSEHKMLKEVLQCQQDLNRAYKAAAGKHPGTQI